MLQQCSWKVIHLPTETLRIPLIDILQKEFDAKVFPAIKGEDAILPGHPLRHPLYGQTVTKGMIGCAESHRRVLIEGLFAGAELLGVFEDDAVLKVSKETIENWIETSVPSNWDMLCLGVNEHVRPFYQINEHTVQLQRFWGTHAMIFKRETVTKVLAMFEKLQAQGIQPIADWWYSSAIEQYNLHCYAPTNPKAFFEQQVGFVSAITGKVRL